MPRTIKQYPHSDVELANQEGLSQRKCEILYLAAQGLTEKEIAAELDISPATAKAHLNLLRDQFNAVNRTDLVSQAWAHGVLQAATKNVRMSLLRRLSECFVMPTMSELEPHCRWNPTRTRRSVGVSLGQKEVAPVFQEPATGEDDYLNIPTAQRRKILRMVENCRLTDAERLERYVREATQRFYAQEAAA